MGACTPKKSPALGPAPLGQLTHVASGQFSASAKKGPRQTGAPSWDFFLQVYFVLAAIIGVGVCVISVLFCLTPERFSCFLTMETPGGRGEGLVTLGVGGVETDSSGSAGGKPTETALAA